MIAAIGLVLALVAGLASPVPAASLALTDAGLEIEAGTLGKFTLGYPILLAEGEKQGVLKPIEKRVAGKQATVKYEGGGQLTLAIQGADTVAMEFSSLPAGVRKFRMDMLVDFGFSEGGTWQIGDGAPKLFPKEKPPRPFLFQGNAETLRLTNAEGKSLSFRVPRWSFQQLQDNREWNWQIFAWMFIAPLDPNPPYGGRCTLTISEGAAAGGVRRVVVADRFGQDAQLDFPGKVKEERELKEDVAREDVWSAGFSPYSSQERPKGRTTNDAFGGQAGSGQRLGLKRTGFFRVEQAGERWLMVDPEGNAVFHLGICGFQPSDDYTYVKGREQAYEWLPSYDGEFHTAFHPDAYWSHDTLSFYIVNLIRKYGKPFDREEWTSRIIPRVRKWGFNATGAFSGVTKAHRAAGFPYVASLPLGEWELGRQIPGLRGLFDPFDPATLAKMDELFAKHVAPAADDPLLIGYFLANEQAFEDVPRVVPMLRGSQPAKRRLVRLLEEKYKAIADFNRAWGTAAASFPSLEDAGLPVSTREAAADMQAFTELFLNEYFRSIVETFRKHDRNHLLLGNRWQPGTANNETLCRVAGKFMDVISLNYYTYAVDKEFLSRLDRWCGNKPMMLSEFYWASPSDTGLPGGKEVRSQRERGLAYRNYVEQAAALPFVIGIEWFTLIDQARTGRFFERYSGEKANTGLLSVTDRSYRDCLAEMMKTNYDIYAVLFGERKPFAYDDPRFAATGATEKKLAIPRAPGPIRLDGRSDDWPGAPPERISAQRLVEGADAGGFEGVFRLCWDDAKLYLLVEVTDPTPMKNDHKGDSVWSGDGVELFIGSEQVDRPGSLLFGDRQVLLSAGLPGGAPQWHYANAPRQYGCEMAVIPKVDGKGYVLEAAIPFEALGFQPKDGQELRFDLALDNSADGQSRASQLMWNGVARNSGDRTHWGRAVLTK